MSKKVKLIVGLLCMIIIMCICTTAFVLYAMKQKMDGSTETIVKLEEEVKIANDKAKKVEAELNDTKEQLVKTSDELIEVSEELKESKKASKETETVASAKVSTPEPMPAPTEAPTETAPMDICGNFEEIGSGRVQIRVTPHDASASADYLVTIEGSNGAMDNSSWYLTGNWDAGSSSIIYQGIREDNVNGVQTTYDGITGSLRFDGPNTLYWTDESTGNYDRGPFSKY